MEKLGVKVSIIVPVYNVADYISECIDSLINQTYQNLEIICVDDASGDSSFDICRGFESIDARVKVYRNAENRGAGFTRNKGVDASHGDYIFFIDSDDWLPGNAIEKLVKKAVRDNSDICVGAMSHYNQILDEHYVGWRDVNDEFALKSYLNWSMCNKLYKSSFYKDNKFRQHEGVFEDAVTWPLLMRTAEKVSLVKDVTYNYRRFSGKSKSDRWENALNVQDEILSMVSNFSERGYSVHDRLLYEAAFTLAKSSLGHIRSASKEGKCQMEVYENLKKEVRKCLENLFPDFKDEEIAVLGSSSLNQIYRNLVLEYKPAELKTPIFNFSSIISMASNLDPALDCNFFHEKIFRKNMLKKDWMKLFWNENYADTKFLLIDLLDERCDIISRGQYYYTKSEAFEEAFMDGMIYPFAVIKRMSAQCDELWKKCCKKFVEKLSVYKPNCKIILLELYLTDSYGSGEKKTNWKNQVYINNTNQILKNYYSMLKELAPDLAVISVEKEKMYTDEKYPYGCYPWHYNSDLYTELTEKVRGVING